MKSLGHNIQQILKYNAIHWPEEFLSFITSTWKLAALFNFHLDTRNINCRVNSWEGKKLTNPIHWPTHGQWWSNFWTQLLQIEQWEARGGRYSKQVSQNFTFTTWPLTCTSFIRGILKLEALLLTHSIDPDISYASSESGGREFLGMIPGSLPDVKYRKVKSCMSQYKSDLKFFIWWSRLPLYEKEFQFTNQNSEDYSPS